MNLIMPSLQILTALYQVFRMLLLISRSLILTDLPEMGPITDQLLTLLISFAGKLKKSNKSDKDTQSKDTDDMKAVILLLKRCIQVKNLVEYQEGLGVDVKPILLENVNIKSSY